MTEATEKLQELRKGSVKLIVPQLPTLQRDELVALIALEGLEDNPRESLLKALGDQIDRIDADNADDGADDVAPPAWQSPEYSGALTIDQASWRNLNLKPVDEVETK